MLRISRCKFNALIIIHQTFLQKTSKTFVRFTDSNCFYAYKSHSPKNKQAAPLDSEMASLGVTESEKVT